MRAFVLWRNYERLGKLKKTEEEEHLEEIETKGVENDKAKNNHRKITEAESMLQEALKEALKEPKSWLKARDLRITNKMDIGADVHNPIIIGDDSQAQGNNNNDMDSALVEPPTNRCSYRGFI